LAFDEGDWDISARYISNVVGASNNGYTTKNPRNISSYLTVWGQFIDHDIIYTKNGNEAWNIEVPEGDPIFDPDGEGGKTIGFTRTYGDKTKINLNTCWIDASNIYGSNYAASNALRTFEDGLLRVSNEIDEDDGEFPPFLYELPDKLQSAIPLDNNAAIYPTDHLFALGDRRANENPLLLALHVLFWREHNRVARVLASVHPDWDDDDLFGHARKYVIATIQHITYTEYFQYLLARPFPELDYYDEDVDPRIHIFFATVAFRYGHSEITEFIKRSVQGQYRTFPQWQHSKLNQHFFDPYLVLDAQLSSVFEGLAYQVQQSPDALTADSIRNYLFQGKSKKPLYDLLAIDIQRGRDHKIPSFNHARKAYGLKTYDSWDDFDALDIHQNATLLREQLSKIYRNPWEADSFIGGIASNWVRTNISKANHDYSNLGDLFEAAIISQFQRTRVGDRFWYSRNLDEVNCNGDLPPVEKRTLADVIRDNIAGVNIPDQLFKVNFSSAKKLTDQNN